MNMNYDLMMRERGGVNKQKGNTMKRQLAMAALACGILAGSAMAQSPPNATIATTTSQVQVGDDVKFKATISTDPGYAVAIRVDWAGYDRYWWVNPSQGFEFSFPCNSTNKGEHKITIKSSNSVTESVTENAANLAGFNNYIGPAYNIGTPSSATATCNAP